MAAAAPKHEPGRDAAGRRRTAAISVCACNESDAGASDQLRPARGDEQGALVSGLCHLLRRYRGTQLGQRRRYPVCSQAALSRALNRGLRRLVSAGCGTELRVDSDLFGGGYLRCGRMLP
jgi:hypothetical protein